MQLYLHQTHHTIADFQEIQKTLKNKLQGQSGLHIFPELYLTGYPLQDLCLQKSFISSYLKLIKNLNQWLESLSPQKEKWQALVGGIDYALDSQGLPSYLKNSIFLLEPGSTLKSIYAKQLLPNYDIFDEKKYFIPGNESVIWETQEKKFALMICEDMWPSSTYYKNPTQDFIDILQDKKNSIDAIINISASPYHIGKSQKRHKRAMEISAQLGAPFIYVNRVGGEDEILFDGQSFVANSEKILLKAKSFEAQDLSFDLNIACSGIRPPLKKLISPNTWEELYAPHLDFSTSPPQAIKWSTEDTAEVLDALIFGLREYSRKCKMKKYVVALSGGIDSALVLTLVKLSLQADTSVEAIYMPGNFSAPMSYELCENLCRNLNVTLRIFSIKFLHSTCRNLYKENFGQQLPALADENIQSRLRGMLLFARANDQGSMVLNTSNKSEISVGYSTLYGDSVGAISLLGDLFKTEVFHLAQYINNHFHQLIPQGILDREPSAELRENQTDAQSLLPYDLLDPLLEAFLCNRYTFSDLVDLGFNETDIKKILTLYLSSEFKRSQFCPILKIKAKSFGFGHRLPICKSWEGTMDEEKGT